MIALLQILESMHASEKNFKISQYCDENMN